MKVTSDIFPQLVEDGSISTLNAAEVLDRSLDRYTKSNNIPFARCLAIKSWQSVGNQLRIVCESGGFINRVVMTHETTMNQFKAEPGVTGEIEVCIEFWSEGVFRVRFAANPLDLSEPDFPSRGQGMLVGDPNPNTVVDVREDGEYLYAATSELTLRISKDLFSMSGWDSQGRFLFSQQRKDLVPADIIDMSLAKWEEETAVFDAFALSSKEEIFGLGERFDHLARRGVVTDFWNKDAYGTTNRRTYINVPFVLSTNRYGLFLNSSARTEWEIGTKEASTLGFGTETEKMDYFVINGSSLAEVLYRYAGLTGFSPVPPVWSFGLWMSRNSYLNWDIVHEVADGLRKRGIPADVLHLDTAWFKKDWNCDLRFSEERFGEPEKHFAALKEQGFRVSLWQYNFIPPREDNVNFVEAREKGYLAKDRNGAVYTYDNDLPGSWKDDAVIDFSNPEAAAWYADQIKKVIAAGGAAIKTDFGEGVPEDAVYANISGKRFHNLYTLIYNQTIFNATKEAGGEGIVWARSGTAGSQRYPLHWGGDSQCSFAGLAGTLRGGLSAGLSGIAFFSHDIGGFIGRPTPELYIRWAQLGLFTSHARCHGGGNNNSREPWAYGPEAEEIFARYDRLRYRLLPYIITESHAAASRGLPMMRAMILEDEEDRNLWRIDDQYMFGRYLLIAPVLEPMEHTCVRQVYLPKGDWFDFHTKQKITSTGEWLSVEVTLNDMPIFVKSGAILPYGEEKVSTENTIWPVVRAEVYGDSKAEYTVTDGNNKMNLFADGQNYAADGTHQIEWIRYQ